MKTTFFTLLGIILGLFGIVLPLIAMFYIVRSGLTGEGFFVIIGLGCIVYSTIKTLTK